MKYILIKSNLAWLSPIVVGGSVLVFIFWSNFSPLGHQVIEYNFEKSNPFTKGILPLTRVEPIRCKDIRCSQEIFEDPTYIDLLLPRRFEQLKVEVTYENKNIPISLGLHSGAGWNYVFSPLKVEVNGGLARGIATFDLDNAYIEKRNIQLMISIPQLKNNTETLRIDGMKFILDRESIFKKIIRKIKSL